MDNLQRQHNLHIHHMAWETDPTCIQISHYHYPDMEHRGNIFRDNPQAVADRIQFLDPDQSWSLAITAGPPCPDFSRIKGSHKERAETELKARNSMTGLRGWKSCSHCWGDDRCFA